MKTYTIVFMRGDVKTVEAESEAESVIQCHKKYPETRSYDILRVVDEEGLL